MSVGAHAVHRTSNYTSSWATRSMAESTACAFIGDLGHISLCSMRTHLAQRIDTWLCYEMLCATPAIATC